MPVPRHCIEVTDFSKEEVLELLDHADDLKKHPGKADKSLLGKTLLMIFEKPSLRTRVSFESGMTQMGGHAIFYSIKDSPLGKKETMADTARTASRMVDAIMARLLHHEDLLELAQYATVPVINALTDLGHPCQVLADFQTIREKLGRLAGLRFTYLGDGENNLTYSLMLGGALMGVNVTVGCPSGSAFAPKEEIVGKAKELAEISGSCVEVIHDARAAAQGADVLYTDSWMSYHIPADKEAERVKIFSPFRVTPELMEAASPESIFMHCLPAQRGYEVSGEVIDGPRSVIFDQAENRLHAQKAVLLKLIGGD